jgi:hypothetical protein
MNFKTLKNLVATTVLGLWVIPSTAYSQTVQDYIGLTTVAGGFQHPGGRDVIASPNRTGHIQISGSAGSWFTYTHNGNTYPGHSDNSGTWQGWSQNGQVTFAGDRFTHVSWGPAVIFNQAPSSTWNLIQKINVSGTETTISQTTPEKNSTVNISTPSHPNSVFKFWTKNGTSQATPLPTSFTITENTTIVFHFDENPSYTHNISLPADSYTARAVTVTGSVQGALVTGYILQPGQTFSASYFAIPGETITVTVDGVVVSTHTFELENPISHTDNINLSGVPQPTPTPTPTPSPSPTPLTIFNGTNNIPPPSSTPPPINGGGGGGNTGGGGDTSIPDVPNPPPTPPPTTTNNIPNPFGTFNPTNKPTDSTADLYGTIKQAIKDATGEQGPQEQPQSDVGVLNTNLNNNATDFTNNLSSTVGKVYQLTDELGDLAENGSDLVNSFIPQFPDPGTTSTVSIDLPVVGGFTLNINNLPGLSLFRSITTFFLWLMAIIFAVHIIRKAIA